jgi:hypothetical protein
MNVDLEVGGLRQRLVVIGDREWDFPSRLSISPSMTPALPFQEMPLRPERAYGGVDRKSGTPYGPNPRGTGFAESGDPASLHKLRLPNIEHPADRIRKWSDRPFPAGFGCVDRTSPTRLCHLGVDLSNGAPAGSFSFEAFNSAHPILQVPQGLWGDERVRIQGMTPEGDWSFRLPGRDLEVTVEDAAGIVRTPRMMCDTLCLFPNQRRFTMVWRGLHPVRDLGAEEVRAVRVRSGVASMAGVAVA